MIGKCSSRLKVTDHARSLQLMKGLTTWFRLILLICSLCPRTAVS